MTPQNKGPRRWWICQTPGFDGDAYDTDPRTWNNGAKKREPTEVVEASSFDQLKAELELANNRLTESIAYNEATQEELELADEDKVKIWKELTAAREAIEKEKKCHSLAKLACEQLIKERTTYRTIDSLLGDNGEICELHDDIEALEAKCEDYKTQCEKLLEYLKDVIRNSYDILAKKHCSNGLAEHEAWLKEQK